MTRHEFTKDTRYLYTSLSECVFDCPDQFQIVVPLLESLANGNMEGIRQGFQDGFIAMMAPELMEFIDNSPRDDEIEIRIVHDGKTIGVVINSEITW